ncbi:MAG: molybdate ABC transporter substrate-binding protein [Acidobacteriota bacterium]|nr:molybdate ABC transporter substrate-binding protein [Acidobacteriota bacterium]
MTKVNCRYGLMSIFLVALLAGCRASAPTNNTTTRANGEIIVSAAISLRDAFQDIGNLYETRTGAKVKFNFGASGALQRQIETGAPVDLFASAGAKQMDELVAHELIDKETRRDFARNALVLIVPVNATRQTNSFADLANPQMQRLAVGNPKTVPAGQYAEQLLTNIKLLPALQSRLIFGEDVRQVLDYVARGEVDAGIVYATDASAAKDRVRVIDTAREDLHDPILYPLAIIKDSRHEEDAKRFRELVLGPEGQSILQKYGFLTSAQ